MAIEGTEAAAWRARMRSYLGGIRNGQGHWAQAVSDLPRSDCGS